MDVLRIEVIQVQPINVCCVLDVQLHARHGDLVLDISRYLREAASVSDALRFHLGRDSKAECVFAASCVRYHKVCFKRIQASLGAFYGCIKRFHINAEICV